MVVQINFIQQTMTNKHKEIIQQIENDEITVTYVSKLGTPGKYSIDTNDGKCSIQIDRDILNGSDPENFNNKRCELVLYHEWGHIKDYRKNPKNFVQLNSINQCHKNLEYEAYYYALQVAVKEAKSGDKLLLLEAHKRYRKNMKSHNLNEGYKKALIKIFQSDLWNEAIAIIN